MPDKNEVAPADSAATPTRTCQIASDSLSESRRSPYLSIPLPAAETGLPDGTQLVSYLHQVFGARTARMIMGWVGIPAPSQVCDPTALATVEGMLRHHGDVAVYVDGDEARADEYYATARACERGPKLGLQLDLVIYHKNGQLRDSALAILKAYDEPRSYYGDVANISKLAYGTVKKIAARLKKHGLLRGRRRVERTEAGTKVLLGHANG